VSILVMSQVWRYQALKGTKLLLALALADHAHDDGTHVYPSVEALTVKTRANRRTVQKLLRELVDDGLLAVVEEGGKGPKDTTVYAFDLRLLAEGRSEAALPAKGGISSIRAASRTDKGGLTPPEPSENHQEEPPDSPASPDGARGEVIELTMVEPTRLARLLSTYARVSRGVPPQSPQFKPTKGGTEAIEKLHRIDGVDYQEIEAFIEWLHHSDSERAAFWRANILSGEKLRKQFFRVRDEAAREQQQDGGLLAFLSPEGRDQMRRGG